jgi:hypothetical protein
MSDNNQENPNCPKCSSNNSCYLFCKNCTTYYCMTCHLNYYVEDNNNKRLILENHNPHCDNKDDMSSIDLSDYDE